MGAVSVDFGVEVLGGAALAGAGAEAGTEAAGGATAAAEFGTGAASTLGAGGAEALGAPWSRAKISASTFARGTPNLAALSCLIASPISAWAWPNGGSMVILKGWLGKPPTKIFITAL